MSNSKRTWDAGTRSSKSNTGLLNEIDDILMQSDSEDVDADAIVEMLNLLEDRAPTRPVHTQSEAWAELEAKISTKETAGESPRKHIKWFRVLRFVEIAAVVILALGITAIAAGYNPFQPIIQLFGDVASVFSDPGGQLELPDYIDIDYHSLQEALDVNGAEDAQCITWIPKDYSFSRATVRNDDYNKVIVGFYESSYSELIVRIQDYGDEYYSETFERNIASAMSNVIIRDNTYYFTENYDKVSVWWKDDRYYYHIRGTVTKEEMESMIKSLQ